MSQANNTMVAHAKLKTAILNMHQEKACLFGTEDPEQQAAEISGIIRMYLSKWRSTYTSEKIRSNLSQRADWKTE